MRRAVATSCRRLCWGSRRACRFKCERAVRKGKPRTSRCDADLLNRVPDRFRSLLETTHMIITKMALPRRTFLRGMGATLALPLLDAMVPAMSAAQTAARPSPRLGFFYAPNGTYLPNFHPRVVGKNFEFTPVLKPLEGLRDHLVVVS